MTQKVSVLWTDKMAPVQMPEAIGGNQFSPLTMWIPGIELGLSGLAAGTLTY